MCLIHWLIGSLAKKSHRRCACPPWLPPDQWPFIISAFPAWGAGDGIGWGLASIPGKVNTLHNPPWRWSMVSRVFRSLERAAAQGSALKPGLRSPSSQHGARRALDARGKVARLALEHPASLLRETAPARQNQFPIDFQPPSQTQCNSCLRVYKGHWLSHKRFKHLPCGTPELCISRCLFDNLGGWRGAGGGVVTGVALANSVCGPGRQECEWVHPRLFLISLPTELFPMGS